MKKSETSRMSSPNDLQCRSVESLYAQPVVPLDDSPLQSVASPCEVCGCRQVQPVYDLPGTPYQLVRCVSCGLGSLSPQPTPDELTRYYPSHYYGSEGRKFSPLIEWLVRIVGARHAHFLARQCAPGRRILDVGCGRGVTLKALADQGYEAHGFEVHADAMRGIDPRIHTHIADSLQQADFPAESFDEVLIWHVLEHIPNPRQTLSEIHRILRPGGVLIVAVPNWSSWQARWAGSAWFHLDPPRHLFHFPLKALKQLLTANGFTCQSEHHFSLRQNPYGWIQSALNRIPWLPRNGLYALLHRRQSDPTSTPPPTVRDRWQHLQFWLFLIVFAAPALGLSVFAALCRQGATVHVVAVRNP